MTLRRALFAATWCAAAFAAAQTPPSAAPPPQAQASPAQAQPGPADEVLPAVRMPGARADADATPFGLSVVWHLTGRKLARGATGTALNAFSPDGRLVAVYDSTRV